ncbi:MAG: DUF3305 domain-containing protein [Telluria sp.]
MRMASMPIAVIMQRRTLNNRWVDEAWSAIGVVPDCGDLPPYRLLQQAPERETYLVSGLSLDLYPDENEGYFENCIAPEAKVFIKWRMLDGRAMPVQASVSYADGARMFDSGESADGVVMPAEIQAWLAEYLHQHYEPPVKRGKDYTHHKQGDHAH